MKNTMKAILIGMAVITTAICSANAKTETIEANIIAIWPNTPNPGNVVKYTVEVTRTGTGKLDVEIGTIGLPKGSGVTFSPEILSFTGNGTETLKSIVTINLSKITPIDGQWSITAEANGLTLTVNMHWQDGGSGGSPVTRPTLSIVQTAPTSVEVHGLGTSAAAYDIQSATDLGSTDGWVLSGTCTADANGRFTFGDTISSATPARFYRSAQPATGGTTAPTN